MSSLTSSAILAAAEQALVRGGYRHVTVTEPSWSVKIGRLYEDPYAIVAVVVYDTWLDLASGWHAAQASLVELMSSRLSKSEAKAWDGYLALFTPASPGVDRTEVTSIRYNTARLRKLIATGDDLTSISDVRRTLLPLLPIDVVSVGERRTAFTLLETELARRGIDTTDAKQLIEAFRRNESLLEALDRDAY